MSGNDVAIHPTAVVHPQARLEAGVRVGAHCVIGEHVSLGRNTRLESHVALTGWTEIGADNVFSPFVSVGTEPQDMGYKGEPTQVRIGDRNVFREFVTINRATTKEQRLTSIGSDNYFMAHAHVGHDCRVGDRTVFLHQATLGGHVTVEDFVMVGALSGVHQFCRLGRFAFMGGGSMITQDVLPFCRVVGQRPTRVLGLNIIGLRRNGFSNARIAALKDIYKIFFFSELNTAQAVARIEAECPPGEDREEILRFMRAAKRGVVKKTSDAWDSE
jgi:UDP-N-acetylglucosamine acyltransferase